LLPHRSFAMAVIALGLSACTLFNPNRQDWIYSGSSNSQVLLAYDSPEIRRLLADEDAREEEFKQFWRDKHTPKDADQRIRDEHMHPERYPPGRQEFLRAVTNMPGFAVASKSYCRVIERSKAGCGPHSNDGSVYVLVRVTTGRSRGKTGWVCNSNAPGFFP
jgi:hypothetical protein